MEWVLTHMDDPDFNEPLPAPAAAASAAAAATSSAKPADPDSVAMLTGMGFTCEQVRAWHTASHDATSSLAQPTITSQCNSEQCSTLRVA